MQANKKSLAFHKEAAEKRLSETDVYSSKTMDMINLDINFILNQARHFTLPKVLDLGSGTGVIVNEVEPFISELFCVEFFQEFSSSIKKTEKITLINADVLNFKINKKFDLITCFGMSMYFDKDEITKIYKNALKMINSGGLLIVKNQFGIEEDVLIDNFSEELQKNYYANYRQVDSEISLLKDVGFNKVEKYDIYPSRCNKWDNTHYYALVASI